MVSRYPIICVLWFAVCALYAPLAASQSASLEASVERQTVIDGESVQLYIRGTNLSQMPDVSALNRQFDIVDSRRSNKQIIEGGVRKTQFLMRFELLPKNLGQTEIPVFTADGQSTQAIRIDVVPRGTPGTAPRDKVFAEVTLDKSESYVQEQVVMSLHILDDGTLASVDPPIPDIPNVQVEQLSAGAQSIVERNAEQYRMHTWRFALFPQRAGTIEIPRIQIPGSVRDADYGGGLIMRSMATRRISIRTPTVEFRAKPKAPQSTSDWWLPVKEFDVRQQWSGDIADSSVGEPLTLSFLMSTIGSTSNQIPEIKVPDVDGLKIYRDVPELESQPSDDGLIGQRRERWSVIPQRAGTLKIPALTLKWWDTKADIERVVNLPEQVIVSAGDPAQQMVTPQLADSAAVADATGEMSVTASAGDAIAANPLPPRSGLWPWLAIMALCGWLLTAVAWAYSSWRRKPKINKKVVVSDKELLNEIATTGKQNDARAFRAALIRWGGNYWPDNAPVSPVEIAQRLDNDLLLQQIRELESALYSPSAKPLSLPAVYNTLCEALSVHRKMERSQHSLPSL